MSDVTRILAAAEAGDPQAAAELLPLVYAEEKPGQTLQPTDLVHEAYLRLVGDQAFDGRGHFFSAAAEAMRRILVDAARRKRRLKHGGGRARERGAGDVAAPQRPEWLLDLSEALDRLVLASPQAAELVKLRYFAGLTNAQAAKALHMSPRKANQVWAYARAWLREEIGDGGGA
jgi:RNA polymerase sigma factor (TIGR02999 family)